MHPITHFDGCRNAPGQQARVEDTRAAALDFRRHMLAGPRVRYFESFDLIKLVYPVRYGLRNAYPAERLNEYLHIHNRLFVVQYDTPHGLKTLLVSPSDHERGGETPFCGCRTPRRSSSSTAGDPLRQRARGARAHRPARHRHRLHHPPPTCTRRTCAAGWAARASRPCYPTRNRWCTSANGPMRRTSAPTSATGIARTASPASPRTRCSASTAA
ncbi:hypothetical protein [Rhodanobacter lindaniclasticus]